MNQKLFRMLGGLLFVTSSIADAATIVFTDDTFNDGDWMRSAFVFKGSGSFVETADQALDGGNPGAYRLMTHTFDPNLRVIVRHWFVGLVYDPSVQGPILHLDYSEDQFAANGVPGWGVVLRQDDVIWRTDGMELDSGAWRTEERLGLTACSFFNDEIEGTPDFTANGGPIEFGYWRSNTGGTTTHGIDNWTVVVTVCSPVEDVDGDTVVDAEDNCLLEANTDQRDTNADGFGNACDPDLNNDNCSVNFVDLGEFKAAFGPNSYNPDADFNGDGFVNFIDLGRMKELFFNGAKPGPGPSCMGPTAAR